MGKLTIVSIVLTLILVSIINEKTSSWFILLGQGHFILSYFYKFRSNQLDKQFYWSYTLLAVFLFSTYLYFEYYKLLYFVTSLYFVIHFILDIFYLNKVRIHIVSALKISLPLLIIFLSIILQSISFFSVSEVLCWYVYPLSFLVLFFSGKLYWHFTLGFALLSLFFFLSKLIFAYGYTNSNFANLHTKAMGIIIISHYLMWYVYYLYKSKDVLFINKYLYHVFVVNFIVIIFFFLYENSKFQFLDYFFQEDFFYIWTLLHYFSTFRKSDFSISPSSSLKIT